MTFYQASLPIVVLHKYYKLFGQAVNVLLSMALLGSDTRDYLVTHRNKSGGIILDSGAWSVNSGRSSLQLPEYIRWLKMFRHLVDRYFNFDTDFSNDGFAHNNDQQMQMEREGLSPVPVIHNFYNDEIEYYIDKGVHTWLALGSSQCTNFKELEFAVNKIKRLNPDMKIHWFGGGRFDWLIKLPIAASDTTSWAQTGAHGCINYWNPKKTGLNKQDKIYMGGRMHDRNLNEHYVTHPDRHEIDEYLRAHFQLDNPCEQLVGPNSGEVRQLVNLHFYVELENRINAERIRTGVPLE